MSKLKMGRGPVRKVHGGIRWGAVGFVYFGPTLVQRGERKIFPKTMDKDVTCEYAFQIVLLLGRGEKNTGRASA